MKLLGDKLVCFIFQLICFIIHLANLFLTDIMMYEISEGVRFEYAKLADNRFFWIILVLQLIDVLLCICVNRLTKNIDDTVAKAYSDCNKKLLSQIPRQVKRGDYYSANKTLDLLDEIENRRKGGSPYGNKDPRS